MYLFKLTLGQHACSLWRGLERGSSGLIQALSGKRDLLNRLSSKFLPLELLGLLNRMKALSLVDWLFLAMLPRLSYYLVGMEFILLTLNQCSCKMLTVFFYKMRNILNQNRRVQAT